MLARLLGRGRSPVDVLLIKTRGCCLCDEALELLRARARQLGLAIRVEDVSDRPELLAVYGECVPVVYLDGRLLFTGRVDPMLLRRAVSARRR